MESPNGSPELSNVILISLLIWLWQNWRDLLNVIGFILTIVGFLITYGTLLRTKTAAEQANQAAQDASVKVKKDLAQFDTISGITSAMSAMDELLSLQRRGGSWSEAPERYTRLRRLLIEVRTSNPYLRDEHKTNLQSAISQFADIEEQIEEALQGGSDTGGEKSF